MSTIADRSRTLVARLGRKTWAGLAAFILVVAVATTLVLALTGPERTHSGAEPTPADAPAPAGQPDGKGSNGANRGPEDQPELRTPSAQTD